VHRCPWPCAYLFDHVGRRLFQRPERLLAPYLGEGMTALDVGCGMGFFSLAMAHLVGEGGRVIAVDVQQPILNVLMRRARRRRLAGRIRPRRCEAGLLDVDEPVDFALAMWAVHEVVNYDGMFRRLAACLKPGGLFLLAEPKLHVSRRRFAAFVEAAEGAGLQLVERPRVGLSQAALFTRGRGIGRCACRP
jgi:ubiquinone/menaquinone biosynthesis C-methylase UbiE